MFEKEIETIIMDNYDEVENDLPINVEHFVKAYDRVIKTLEYEVIDIVKAIQEYKKVLASLKKADRTNWEKHYELLINELGAKKNAYDSFHTLMIAFRALTIAGFDDGKDDERLVRITELRNTLKASGSAYHYEMLYKWFRSAYLRVELPRLQLEGTEISED